MHKPAFGIKWLLFCLLSLISMPETATADAGQNLQPAWLQQAREEARQDGYTLISIHELKALYDSGKEFITLDVRPEYEFREGHLPRAKNIEFDLGDKLELKPDKQIALTGLLGSDKNQTIVFYCRSFA
jgi:rhodanese-related sulfurtransferase